MINHDDVRPYRSKSYSKRERDRQKGKGWTPSGAAKRRKGPQ
jgi:hypothetical protein